MRKIFNSLKMKIKISSPFGRHVDAIKNFVLIGYVFRDHNDYKAMQDII